MYRSPKEKIKYNLIYSILKFISRIYFFKPYQNKKDKLSCVPFFILGSGRNGKSMLVSLMAKTLGEYKGTVPTTLITQKRGSIGGASPEVIQLKGLRYAVMQEPSKGDKINEGIMKEITGGDPIQARGLYKESETFIPQLKLAVCSNVLLEISSNDDGTWFFLLLIDRAFFIFPLVVLMYFGFEPLIFVFIALILGSIFVFASSIRLGIAVGIDYYFNSKSSKDKYIPTREKNNKKN